MNLKEYKETVKPGTRVYVMYQGVKVLGTAGNLLGADGEEPIIKFDNGVMGRVTKASVERVQIELPN